jgi:hypothetical protein
MGLLLFRALFTISRTFSSLFSSLALNITFPKVKKVRLHMSISRTFFARLVVERAHFFGI